MALTSVPCNELRSRFNSNFNLVSICCILAFLFHSVMPSRYLAVEIRRHPFSLLKRSMLLMPQRSTSRVICFQSPSPRSWTYSVYHLNRNFPSLATFKNIHNCLKMKFCYSIVPLAAFAAPAFAQLQGIPSCAVSLTSILEKSESKAVF